MNSSNEFSVQAKIQGELKNLQIITSETSDGITFYICRVDNNEITQVRKDDQNWKQIWGDLPDEDIKSIGAAIEGAILNE